MDLSKKPVYCFTSDLDWAHESMIGDTLKIFKGIPLTPFMTHRSKVIEDHYGDRRKYVGLHPNFHLDSTHGSNVKDIVSHVVTLWKGARCFRSHSFYDHYYIAKEFFDRGFKYDSNLCLHLQPNIVPLQHAIGLLRFPVFLSDNHYALREGVWDISYIDDILGTPGIKIFNFHPIHIALNTPNMERYEDIKLDVTDSNWKNYVYKGKGVRTFLLELIHLLKNKPGTGIYYLDDLYSIIIGKTITKRYDQSNTEERMKFIKDRYARLDATQTYATSRDFNLRELEINFIIKKTPNSGRILDIGCGNGYTDIRIAKEKKVEIIGVDISKEMIKGAQILTEKFRDELIGEVRFQIGDVRKLKWGDNHFDAIISERCLLNMPNRETQYKTILEVNRVLKKNGTFIMVEGTRDGLKRLNDLRVQVGLDSIPDRMEDNVTSLKFDENELELFLTRYFKIIEKQYFGTYYLISRVVHPLLVAPKQPRFDASINAVAREVSKYGLDYRKLGHIVGYVLRVIK